MARRFKTQSTLAVLTLTADEAFENKTTAEEWSDIEGEATGFMRAETDGQSKSTRVGSLGFNFVTTLEKVSCFNRGDIENYRNFLYGGWAVVVRMPSDGPSAAGTSSFVQMGVDLSHSFLIQHFLDVLVNSRIHMCVVFARSGAEAE